MLTFVEAISLAGDRAKQNDDACGFARGKAWVIDGATDLHDAPLTGWASDAAWIAHFANACLHGADMDEVRAAVRQASLAASAAFARIAGGFDSERWKLPIASLLIVTECEEGVAGLDLGDCRAFALDAGGEAFSIGGHDEAAGAETQLAAQQTDADLPLLKRAATIEMLRRMRAAQNGAGGSWTFSLDPACADHARAWRLRLKRPARLLLMSDGFAALADRYGAYDAGALVRAAFDRGLQELTRELRAIEAADAAGARHPRFKRSDDATALLLRLD